MPAHPFPTALAWDLATFILESNRIEGITVQRSHELGAYLRLLEAPALTVDGLEAFVTAVQPDARLRDAYGLNVQVGRHVPPAGSPALRTELAELLAEWTAEATTQLVHDKRAAAYRAHHEYETLHPFTDGNGRSGRAVWLWMMLNDQYDLGNAFLHEWYYQSLRYGGDR